MEQSGTGQTPPPAQPPAAPPPPPAGWQSTPTPPGAPPSAGGQASGMPSWTSNITARGTMAGPGGVALADTPDRIIAVVIDFIILGLIGFVVGAIIHPILGEKFGAGTLFQFTVPSLLSSLVVALIMLAVAGAYFVGMWTRMQGATVGMRAMKLQVRDGGSGAAVTQQQAITRFAFLAGPWALSWFYSWGIGFIVSIVVIVYYIYLVVTVAQSPTRQGLHDAQAKTVVAKVA